MPGLVVGGSAAAARDQSVTPIITAIIVRKMKLT